MEYRTLAMRCRVVSCCPNSETPGGLAGWNDDRKGPFCVYLLAAILGDLRNTGVLTPKRRASRVSGLFRRERHSAVRELMPMTFLTSHQGVRQILGKASCKACEFFRPLENKREAYCTSTNERIHENHRITRRMEASHELTPAGFLVLLYSKL